MFHYPLGYLFKLGLGPLAGHKLLWVGWPTISVFPVLSWFSTESPVPKATLHSQTNWDSWSPLNQYSSFQHTHRLTSFALYNKLCWNSECRYLHFPDGKTEAPGGPMFADHKHKESGRARIQFQNCLLLSGATSHNPIPSHMFLCMEGHENRGSGAGTWRFSEGLRRQQQTLSSLVPCSNPVSQAAQLSGERWSNIYMGYSRFHKIVCRFWWNFHLLS